MSGKDFSKANIPGAAPRADGTAVKDNIARSAGAALPPAGEAEQIYRGETMTTQGRKGCRQKRINMAFTPSNYSYVKAMSAAAGVTMTKFVNDVLAEYRRSHNIYDELQRVIEGLENE